MTRDEFQLIAAQAAVEAENANHQEIYIDQVARTVFVFERALHRVLLAGNNAPPAYQRVYDWIYTLGQQPGDESEKLPKLQAFVKRLLPDSRLNMEIDQLLNRVISDKRCAPKEVPSPFADDFIEAVRVLPISPKSSAALARRCLQQVLREKGGVKASDLNSEIQQVLDSRALPSYLADAVDAIRVMGNFAAHPIKSRSTGEIIAVEPGEAEWLLDVIEGLFDFYFVQPLRLQARRDALNQKLQAVGKPLLKSAQQASK